MRTTITIVAISLLVSVGCGSEIGDSCAFDTDCSPTGERICDGQSPNGYCTIFGCDFDTCPDEAVCVRFFSVVSNLPCDPFTEDATTDDCTPDELCSLSGSCVPRLAETRFCMKTCGDSGDCREGYECRDRALMELHGGEPVPKPGSSLDPTPTSFCAAAPVEQLDPA